MEIMALSIMMERVCVGRDPAANPLQADRVQANQRNREARPKLLLELGHHALGRDHQDALAFAAFDQFAEQDADLNRLAEANGVGDENSLPRLLQR